MSCNPSFLVFSLLCDYSIPFVRYALYKSLPFLVFFLVSFLPLHFSHPGQPKENKPISLLYGDSLVFLFLFSKVSYYHFGCFFKKKGNIKKSFCVYKPNGGTWPSVVALARQSMISNSSFCKSGLGKATLWVWERGVEDVWIIFLSFVCVMIVSFFLGRFASWFFSSFFSVSSGAEWGGCWRKIGNITLLRVMTG